MYDEWTKEELISEIENLKRRKKYGLVWEAKDEDAVKELRDNYPYLEEDISKQILTDNNKPTNLIIEGDNYHSLSVLNYTHREKIDVIYIDPPYNTGARDWKYNNDYVDSEDSFRHSKWINMMYERLKLAKNLLANEGVLICTIDKYEQPRLILLLEEIFSDKEIHCISIIHNQAGTQGKNFSYNNEFAIFVIPKNQATIKKTVRKDLLESTFRDWGPSSKRENAKNCFYPIIVKNNKIIGFGDVSKDNFSPDNSNIHMSDGTTHIYPIGKDGSERKWVFARNSVEKIRDQLFCRIDKDEITIIRQKSEASYKTVWDDKIFYANIHGSKLLNNIIDFKFPYPKSLYAVKECINAVIHDKDNAVILDFFAGCTLKTIFLLVSSSSLFLI